MTKSDRWILSEWLVAKDRLQRFHESLLYHRHKTPYAELDLIVGGRRDSFVTVLEVKSVGAEAPWAGEAISRRQVARLEKARWMIELQMRRPTRLLLATVHARPGREPLIRYFDAPF